MAETCIISEEELQTQRYFSAKVKALTHVYDRIPLAHVHSYGCQQNVSDGEKLKGMLAEMGFGFTAETSDADVIIFNTCAVRENAEDRVFGNIGALKHLKARKPNLIVGICGCMVQQPAVAERIRKTFPFVDIIFGTHVLHTFPQLLFAALGEGERVVSIPDCGGVIAEGLPVKRESGFKASVPIMYGCNNFCTYCIVPYVRGRERSRSADEIVSEVKSLVADGYKEIMLLGQNVNSYGNGGEVSFPQLLERLDALDGEFCIDFMTSHPKDCTRELIDVIAGSEKIGWHLHLPVQSGSNRILKLMNRHYSRERYIELVKYAREKIDGLMLTTDIIVGFPGETYQDFGETLDLLREVKFDSCFTFIYSKRSGTKAADMPDPVSDEEKGKWFRELLSVQDECGKNSYDRYVGSRMRILCEGRGRTRDGYFTGKSRQNIIVDFDGNENMIGKFVDVEITGALSWALIGKLI